MTAPELLASLRSLGVRLDVAGDALRVDAPAGTLTPEHRAALMACKADLLRILAPARYPFETRWARERGWLVLHDPLSGEWEHEVRARDCPRSWLPRRGAG